ncbi:Uncharacterised protein [Actinobacillus pleuropneumoniae]|nr:Uncharacterised protein [Actinobacillus pleuropneumoniae]
MFGVICITYFITIPIGYLIMNKLPERLKENEKFTTFLLFLWLFIIPCIVAAIYIYYRDYKLRLKYLCGCFFYDKKEKPS